MSTLEERAIAAFNAYRAALDRCALTAAELEGRFRRMGCVAEADRYFDLFSEVDAQRLEIKSVRKVPPTPARR